ncbi:MAG: transporter substrate-binding domain-containing protein, partial [Negativicoccus succinicivorans]
MAKKWTQLLMLVICSLALLISGCGGNDADKGGAAGGDKVLRVGAETTFPPFEFADEKGNYSGFDLDLIHAIAADLGYKVEFKSMGFDALIPALNSKQIDVIIS